MTSWLALAALGVVSVTAAEPAHAGETRIAGTAAIVDGDTIDLGPVRIRLHGIDAPEAGQKCGDGGGGTWPCGDEAVQRLAELVEGRVVDCLAKDRDAYGRIVAVCYVAGVNVDAALVSEGLAWAFVRYSDDYVELEEEARSAGIGVWQGDAQAPWDYRADKWNRAAEASPRPGCPITRSAEGQRVVKIFEQKKASARTLP